MTDPATAEALRRFRDRAGHLVELVADDPDNDTWGDVLIQEATFLVEEGPAAYIRYIDRLDDAAVRHELDEELDRILQRGLGS